MNKKLMIFLLCLITAIFTLLLIGCSDNVKIDAGGDNQTEITEHNNAEISDVIEEDSGIQQEEYNEDIVNSVDAKNIEMPKDISKEGYVPQFIIQHDNWIYYTNIDDDNLYKIREDGTEKTKLSSYSVAEIFAVDNRIYFNTVDEGRLYCINTEKGGIERLSNGAVTNMSIVDGWIFYSNLSDQGKIYKMKLDGTLKTKVNDVESSYMVINKDWIYFSNGSDNNCIYKVKIDGTDMEKLDTDKSKHIMISDGYLYYLNMSKHSIYSYLYRMKLDGTQKTELNEIPVTSYTIKGEWIFFVDGDDMHNSIYKMKNDGKEISRLFTSDCGDIFFSGNHIYYKGHIYDYKELYSVGIDSLEKKCLIPNSNLSSFSIKENWIFYINELDCNRLYKININTLENVKITDASVICFEIYNDNIVYISTSEEKSMYKMNLVTSEIEYLDKNVSDIVKIQDDWIYYTNEKEKLLCRINFEGTLQRHIIKSQFIKDIRGGGSEFYTLLELDAIKVEGEWIYYFNGYDNHRLYRMSLDGATDIKLTNDYIDGFVIDGNQIYYSDEQMESIYKMNIVGEQKTKLVDTYFVQNILLKDNWVYYRPAEGSIYRMKNDGSDKIVLENGNTYDINIIGDNIYYVKYQVGRTSNVDYFEIIKAELDGTNKTILTNAKGMIGDLTICDGRVYYYKYLDGEKIIKMNLNGSIVQIID